MTPIIKTYEIQVAEGGYDGKEWLHDDFIQIDVGSGGHFSFSDVEGIGAKDKPTFVAWLRKAADAIEKAELE